MEFVLLGIPESTECLVRKHFQIYCPGCGGTRAVQALLRLQFAQSLCYNPVVILLILLVACLAGIKVREARRAHKLYTARIVVYSTFLILWLTYSVVRNILLCRGIDLLGDLS